jgi:hypothetical protein
MMSETAAAAAGANGGGDGDKLGAAGARADVRASARNVIFCESPVEVNRTAQGRNSSRSSAFEAAAPKSAGFA